MGIYSIEQDGRDDLNLNKWWAEIMWGVQG